MNITLNGQHICVTEGATVADAVQYATGQADPAGTAVAVGDSVIPRAKWGALLQEGAQVEILTAVQGG